MRKYIEKLLSLWYLWPTLFLGGCAGTTVSVLNDSDMLQAISVGAAALAFTMMVLILVISLFLRRFALSGAVAFAAVGCTVASFLALIMIGAGQHHPPRQELQQEDIPTWSEYCNDTTGFRNLGPELEKGSWWTDGQWFYQVKQTGQTIRLEGYGLHEGGAVCTFKVEVGKLVTDMPTEGYTTFARPGSAVSHYLVAGSDGKEYEVLVALGDIEAADNIPWRILQRFEGEGKELAFVQQSIHDLLEGTYIEEDNEERSWQFYADGTVKTPDAAAEPKPYTIELGYDMPTGVIRLPDGQRVAIAHHGYRLGLYQAEYDQEEEFWTGTDSLLLTLQATFETPTTWVQRHPMSLAILDFSDDSYLTNATYRMEHPLSPMMALNYFLMLSQQQEVIEE